jgi:hypothetical protein
MLGGNASMDAVVAQYLRKPRRETPFARNTSPTVGVRFMLFSSRKNILVTRADLPDERGRQQCRRPVTTGFLVCV